MLRIIWVLLVASAFLGTAGCNGNGGTRVDDGIPMPDESPGISSEEGGGNNLVISKNSLGQEFLFQTLISHEKDYGSVVWNPTSKGMKSRIVTFERHDGELLMIESANGQKPGDELESTILLTTFPIIREDGDKIVFDFNDGMRFYISSWDWYVSDHLGMAIKPEPVYFVESSFVKSVETVGDAVTIIQVMSTIVGNALMPVEATYYLRKYRPNPSFAPVQSPGFDCLGYFETNPIVQKDFGNTFNYITKWDISKPVTYYLSQDIPEEYREAVKEGVLYWNKAFGDEVLKVEMAPDGVKAPNFKHNIIQWHTAHYSGAAYADVQVDPRTGEILHAQVFISSGQIAWAARSYLEYINRRLSDSSDSEEDFSSGFSPEVFVNDFYYHSDVVRSLTNERMNAIVADMLRWVAAHEVGHTLGLRHNFAASTVSGWSGEEEDKILRDYLREGLLPSDGNIPMNSVMEYPSTAARIIAGAMIKLEEMPALPHDEYAIKWGYLGSGEKPVYKHHPFCTDSHVGLYTDCQKYDSGAHMIERSSHRARQSLEKIPWLLSEIYLESKNHFDKMKRKPIEESTPGAKELASTVAFEWMNLLTLLSENLRLKSVLDKYSDLIESDFKLVDEETLRWLEYEISYAGGIDRIFKLIDPDYYLRTVDGFTEKFREVISSEGYKNARLPDGGTVSFSEDEIDYMIRRASELFPAVDENIVDFINMVIARTNLKVVSASEAEEERIARWIEYVITAWRNIDFRYSAEVRGKAVDLLGVGGPLPGWMKSYAPAMVEKVRVRLEEKYGMPVGEINVANFPRRKQDVVSKDLQIYYRLLNIVGDMPIPGPVMPPVERPAGNGDALRWMRLLAGLRG